MVFYTDAAVVWAHTEKVAGFHILILLSLTIG